jgi:2-polyprenyl-3-methyl-5-hydroxy-6-metoxy-1,4-benzoquinol methylase
MSQASNILKDSFGWDVVNWSRSALLWSKELPADLSGLKALEVGCGDRSGGLSLWLASQGAIVTASADVDYSADMNRFLDRYTLSGSVDFELIDVGAIPYTEQFDVVCMKSVLGGIGPGRHLDDQQAALNSIAASLKPGGKVLFVENMEATKFHMALRQRWGAARNQWHYYNFDQLEKLIAGAGLKSSQLGSTGFFGTLGRSEFQKRVLGWIDGVICPLLPRSWHYIGYGVAHKPVDPET